MTDQNPFLPPPYHPPAPPLPAAPTPDPAAFTPPAPTTWTPPSSPPVAPVVGPPVADTSPYGTAPPVAAPSTWPPQPAAPSTEGSRRPMSAARVVLIAALAALAVSLPVAAITYMATTADGPAPTPAPTAAQPTGPGNDVGAVLDKMSPSVVTVRTSTPTAAGTGTGFIYDTDGHVVTNAHVVEGADTVEVDLSSGDTVSAVVVGTVPSSDIAVVRLDDPPAGLTPAELTPTPAEVGTQVVAIGNALDLGFDPSVTLGIVSGTDRSLVTPEGDVLSGLLQTDAAINPGNSGGPLVDLSGRVVGMNTAIIDGAQSVGFALPVDVIVPVADALIAGRTPTSATTTLGVKVTAAAAADPEQLAAAGVDAATSGAFVTEVAPGSGAETAGIAVGDVVVNVDGRPVRTPLDLTSAIRAHAPGDSVVVVVIRDGAELELSAELG